MKNNSLSLAFLAKYIPLASLFPSKSGREAKLAMSVSLEQVPIENLASASNKTKLS